MSNVHQTFSGTYFDTINHGLPNPCIIKHTVNPFVIYSQPKSLHATFIEVSFPIRSRFGISCCLRQRSNCFCCFSVLRNLAIFRLIRSSSLISLPFWSLGIFVFFSEIKICKEEIKGETETTFLCFMEAADSKRKLCVLSTEQYYINWIDVVGISLALLATCRKNSRGL